MPPKREEELEILTTPEVVVRSAHLKTPNLDAATRFPSVGKDGKNSNVKYDLEIFLDPVENPEHAKFIAEIQDIEKTVQVMYPESKVLTKLKSASKLKDGFKGEKPTKDDFESHPTKKVLMLRTKNIVKVFENGHEVGGDSKLLDRGTKVTVELGVRPYQMTTENGKVAGLAALPLKVTVVSRPERNSSFSKFRAARKEKG